MCQQHSVLLGMESYALFFPLSDGILPTGSRAFNSSVKGDVVANQSV